MLVLQFSVGFHEFVEGGCTKRTDAYVADFWSNHVCGVECMDGNLVACDGELQVSVDASTHDAQFHFRTFLASQTLHDFLFRHLNTSNGAVVDGDNAVASKDSHLL